RGRARAVDGHRPAARAAVDDGHVGGADSYGDARPDGDARVRTLRTLADAAAELDRPMGAASHRRRHRDAAHHMSSAASRSSWRSSSDSAPTHWPDVTSGTTSAPVWWPPFATVHTCIDRTAAAIAFSSSRFTHGSCATM